MRRFDFLRCPRIDYLGSVDILLWVKEEVSSRSLERAAAVGSDQPAARPLTPRLPNEQLDTLDNSGG